MCVCGLRLEVRELDRPPSGRQVTTLRIKSEFGDHTYILKMHFTDTVGDLRKYLNKERYVDGHTHTCMNMMHTSIVLFICNGFYKMFN